MAKYVNGKRVSSKGAKVPIIINVYEKDGAVDEVTTGGYLGDIPMALSFGPNPFATGTGNFRGKSYPIEVYINSLGSVPPQKEFIGNMIVEDDEVMDVTPYISDYRLDVLTDEEVDRLSHISTKALHAELISYFEADLKGVGWTPWLSAIQEADGRLGLPKTKWVPRYQEIEGRKAIGCDVIVDINGARFLFGEGGFVHCMGRNLYLFHTDAAIGIFPDGEKYQPAGEDESYNGRTPKQNTDE